MCGSLLAQWGEGYIPHTTILDPQGVVQGNWVGWSDAFGSQMHAVVDARINPTGLYLAGQELLADSDGDGVAEPGETVELRVVVENRGAGPAAGVSAELLCDEDWVALPTATVVYGEIPAGGESDGGASFVLVLDDGAPPVADLALSLRITADSGTTTQALGLPVGERQGYWAADCEAEDGWSHAPAAGWTDPWHLSEEEQQSGLRAWKAGSTGAGDYAGHLDGRLVTPAVELLEYSRLSFLHRMEAEVSGAFPDSAYDGGVVELSLDDGDSWQILPSLSGYNKVFRWQSGGGSPATHPFPGGTPCYSGSFDWEEAVFDLEPWAGETVRLAFRFGSDNGGGGEGWYVDDLQLSGWEEATGLGEDALSRPAALRLAPPAPNPFNPATVLEWSLEAPGTARISVHNLLGQRVAVLLDGPLPAGEGRLVWQAGELAGGLYLLRFESGGRVATRKALLLK